MHAFSEVSLLTDRLHLRPLDRRDASALYAIYSDSEFMRYWSSTPWTHLDQAYAMIDRDRQELADGEHLRLGILLKGADELIGTCSLFNLNWACRRAELGYGIARSQWRKGYMFEAVSALVTFAFADMQLNRLEADIDPRNLASARSLQKLGFIREGLLRERWIVGEETSDSALFGLLARDWRGHLPL